MGRRWSAVAVVALILAAIGFAQTGAGRAALRSVGLAGHAQSYTALYFASPAQLPAQLYSQEALLSAPFVIRNQSSSARRYGWQIVATADGRQSQLATGHSTVASGGTTTVEWQRLASCVGGRLRIEVRLSAPRESISFWTMCASAGTS
jgi:hypothetical protein